LIDTLETQKDPEGVGLAGVQIGKLIQIFAMVDKGKISDTLRLSKNLLDDTEDLIHKAVGWMLRESWKKEPVKVEGFLKANYSKLPRTTLRYAIERIEEKKRKRFLKGVF